MNVPDTDIQLSKKYQTDDNFIFQMIFFFYEHSFGFRFLNDIYIKP